MENPHKARGGTLASKRQTFNKKQFIQYEPDLVEELNDKKTKNQSVSGRLLTLLYNRLSFWSRYAKHQFNGRRYFWKSIPELSEELQYSEKQVGRGLKALEELGMIKREKLNKHNWKHTYYYYLPKSVHTAEPETHSTRTSSSIRSTTSSSCAGSGGSAAVVGASTPPTPAPTASGASGGAVAGARGTGGAPNGTAGSGGSAAVVGASTPPTPAPTASGASGGAVHPKGQHRCGHFGGIKSDIRTPLLENQLRTIVEKCLDYSINPPKPLTGRGVGFAT
jgi:hypothetical protein